MQSIGSLIKVDKEKYHQAKQTLLSNADIKDFIDQYQDIMDDDMIERSISTFNEFLQELNNPTHIPKLKIYANNVYVTYVKRDVALELKYRDKVPSRLLYDESTKKYKGVELSDYQTDMYNFKAHEYITDFIDIYRYGDKSKGIWLHGRFGIGKTYLMAGLATEIHKKQVGVNFVNASQMMDDIYKTMRSNEDNVQRQIEYLSKSEILIIDDLGTENPTKYMLKNVLYPVLKYRGEYNKPTFITSNLTKDDYYRQLNTNKDIQRMDIARLKEQIDVLMIEMQMNGENRRDKA